MLKQICTLTRLELCNIFGWNVFRFTKDKKAKQKAKIMMAVWGVLILMLFGYVGGLSFGLVQLGLAEAILAYLIMIASLILFFLGMFKAGSVIFRKAGLDTLCALPVSRTAIVVSRFLRMYVENLVFAFLVLLPGICVYAWFVRPGVMFYPVSIVGALFVPLIPIAGASLIGAVITGISSRMKHKSLVTAALSVLVVLAIMLGSSKLSAMEGEISPEMLQMLSENVMGILQKVYPPAVWLGSAVVKGDLLSILAYGAMFLTVFVVVICLIAANFYAVCRRLYGTFAKHNYQMRELKKESVLFSLCKREFKRYFSSGVYVTNTIIGPVMGTVLAGMLLFVDMDFVMGQLPVELDVRACIPFILAGIFCMMTTTATSISMEGKNWWIVKSLPLRTKTILDAKILMNLLLLLPFYLVSQILLILALKPGMAELLWFILISAIIIVFSSVYGITINLHFPVMNWESEVSVVKQSASAMLGGMGGFLLALICAVPVALIPETYADLLKGTICVLLLGTTVWLYRKNNRVDLQGIAW